MHQIRNRLQVSMGLASMRKIDRDKLIASLRAVDEALGKPRDRLTMDEPVVLFLGSEERRMVLEPSPTGAIIMAMEDRNSKAAVYAALTPFDAYEVGDAIMQASDDVPQILAPMSATSFSGQQGKKLLLMPRGNS